MRLIDRIMERRIMKQQRDENNTVLGPFRVLDLTDEKGMMCGWILASLGAEVIKVEPPGGDKARNIPPFFKDQAHPEKSLFYFAYNANKKSITLNIETADGRAILKKLVKVSDFIIESFEPGYMDKLSMGYKDLSAINPRIVMTAISPFGQTGPYSMFKSSDLLCSGMSGFMYLTGEAEALLCVFQFLKHIHSVVPRHLLLLLLLTIIGSRPEKGNLWMLLSGMPC